MLHRGWYGPRGMVDVVRHSTRGSSATRTFQRGGPGPSRPSPSVQAKSAARLCDTRARCQLEGVALRPIVPSTGRRGAGPKQVAVLAPQAEFATEASLSALLSSPVR